METPPHKDEKSPLSISSLESLKSQRYPLSLSVEQAEEMERIVQRMKSLIPPDRMAEVSTDYNQILTALCHPVI
jgi:hypothetical protein